MDISVHKTEDGRYAILVDGIVYSKFDTEEEAQTVWHKLTWCRHDGELSVSYRRLSNDCIDVEVVCDECMRSTSVELSDLLALEWS